MEHEYSLPNSQQPISCPDPEQDQASPCNLIPYLEDHF
jgi:hypothetical protein